MAGGMMGGMGGKGGSSSGGTTAADIGLTSEALGQNEQAIRNRYSQLGIGQPAGSSDVFHAPPPWLAARTAASGGSLEFGGPSTMQRQDIGSLPTETGGLEGMAAALTGELFNPEAAAGFGPGGPLEQLAQQNQQQEQSGFAAGANPSGSFGFGANQGGLFGSQSNTLGG